MGVVASKSNTREFVRRALDFMFTKTHYADEAHRLALAEGLSRNSGLEYLLAIAARRSEVQSARFHARLVFIYRLWTGGARPQRRGARAH